MAEALQHGDAVVDNVLQTALSAQEQVINYLKALYYQKDLFSFPNFEILQEVP